MLGRHADQFFKKQATERILAAPPNGDGRSLTYYDRGDRGTGQISRVPGNYETPGPQNQTSLNSLIANPKDMLPGMGVDPRDMLPGMGEDPRDMLPGMGTYGSAADMLPGMGEEDEVIEAEVIETGGGLRQYLPLLAVGGIAAFLILRGRKA